MAARIAIPHLARAAARPTPVSCLAPSRLLARQPTRSRTQTQARRAFSATSLSKEKKYTEEHEWIELDSTGEIGTIGISTYAAKALGDVVYVELPEIDAQFKAGDTIGAVESVKSASDIMTPVAGTITETNGALEEKPGTINKDPEGSGGWIAKIKVEDKSAIEKLMDAGAYAKFTEE